MCIPILSLVKAQIDNIHHEINVTNVTNAVMIMQYSVGPGQLIDKSPGLIILLKMLIALPLRLNSAAEIH